MHVIYAMYMTVRVTVRGARGKGVGKRAGFGPDNARWEVREPRGWAGSLAVVVIRTHVDGELRRSACLG